MKKYILIIIIVFSVVIVTAIGLYCGFYSSINGSNCVEDISAIIIQSFLAGLVTFLGLFFTLMFQEKQAENIFCPFLQIDQKNVPSAEISVDSLNTDLSILHDGSGMDKVRAVKIEIINLKNNTVLNPTITVGEMTKKIIVQNERSNKEERELEVYLLSEKEGQIKLCFDNMYGKRYVQTLIYKYEDTYFKFVSSECRKESHK